MASGDAALSRGRIILFLGLGLVASIYLLSIDGVVGAWKDDAWYVVLGKAVALGEGFRAISLPSPSAVPYYPPGFPTLLAVAWRACPSFPANTVCLKLVPILFALGFSMLCYLVFREAYQASRPLALSVVVLSGVQPYLVSYLGSTVMAEMPYAFLSMAAILVVQRYARCPRVVSWQLPISMLLLAGTYLVRNAGLSLILASGIYLMMASTWRKAFIVWTGAVLLLAPWTYMSLKAPSGGDSEVRGARSYLQQFLQTYDVQGSDAVGALLATSRENLQLILRDAIPTHVLPVSAPILRRSATWAEKSIVLAILEVAGILVAVVVALRYVGALRALSRFKADRLLELYLLCYTALILLWPFPPTRFFLPFAPLLTFYFVSGVSWTISVVLNLGGYEAEKYRAGPALVTGILVVSLGLCHLFIDARHIYDLRWRPVREAVFYKDWAEIQEAYWWIRSHTPPGVLLASENPAQAYLYTGRLAIHTPSSEEQLRTRQVGYVLRTHRDQASWLEESGLLSQAFSTRGGNVTIFRVKG